MLNRRTLLGSIVGLLAIPYVPKSIQGSNNEVAPSFEDKLLATFVADFKQKLDTIPFPLNWVCSTFCLFSNEIRYNDPDRQFGNFNISHTPRIGICCYATFHKLEAKELYNTKNLPFNAMTIGVYKPGDYQTIVTTIDYDKKYEDRVNLQRLMKKLDKALQNLGWAFPQYPYSNKRVGIRDSYHEITRNQ